MNKNSNNLKSINSVSLPVKGMTCASCVARVEKSISKIDGIKNVSVNLATEKASFEIDTEVATLEQVKKTVEDAGYKILISSAADKSKNSADASAVTTEQKSEYESQLEKDFLLAAFLSIPIILLNMSMLVIQIFF